MRQISAALTRRVSLALVAALIGALVCAVAVSAKPAEPLAPAMPGLPACFAGVVTAENGAPLPGMTVVARAVSGYWTGQVVTVSDALGRYGWNGEFCIPGYDSRDGSGAKPLDQIGFFVNGMPVLLYDVATGTRSTTYTFQLGGGSATLNLIVPLQETIEAMAGPNCTIDPSGSVRVDYGTDQTFTFAGAPGYQVDQLFVDDVANSQAAAAGSHTFTDVRRGHTIRVTCIKSTYTITATAGEGCTITPSGAQIVPLHGNITFTIGAQPGYNLTGVTVDAVSQGSIPTYTFTDVTAEHTIAATCTVRTFKVFLPIVMR